MNSLPKIFIASSSEGNEVSNAIAAELKRLAGDTAIIKHWTNQFQLSQVYIEALEELVKNCDFGVFVLTADDLLYMRNTETRAPRDNVIFELGLFMGGLGRKRCFIFAEKDKNKEVKTPSDLLGLEKSEFTRPDDGSWGNILTVGCTQVLAQVFDEGKLYRVPKDVKDYVSFRECIRGYWWNKIDNMNWDSIAFVTIRDDEAYNSVKLVGNSFSSTGELRARWQSQFVNLVPDTQKLVYHWTGRNQGEANVVFSGFGELTFDGDNDLAMKIHTAHGHFFDINEARIQESRFKTVTLKRETDDIISETMLNGNGKEKALIVQEVSKNW